MVELRWFSLPMSVVPRPLWPLRQAALRPKDMQPVRLLPHGPVVGFLFVVRLLVLLLLVTVELFPLGLELERFPGVRVVQVIRLLVVLLLSALGAAL